MTSIPLVRALPATREGAVRERFAAAGAAEVVLVEDKKQYARAQVKRRLTDSPQRQAPRCPHFGVCGGCQQQHASVALQQQSKRAALARLMKRGG
jgi:tRNA/tmRNA/rRNA uracil-C5-methylase (TrmA/RlmC/RlmD family)